MKHNKVWRPLPHPVDSREWAAICARAITRINPHDISRDRISRALWGVFDELMAAVENKRRHLPDRRKLRQAISDRILDGRARLRKAEGLTKDALVALATDEIANEALKVIEVEDPGRSHAIVDLVNQLRQEEGTAITINYPNPDFDGPNECIEMTRDFGAQAGTFTGETLLECLQKAIEAKERKAND